MSYPLINGSAINSEVDDGLVLFGLDLVIANTAEMVQVLVAGGSVALQPGDINIVFAIEAEGLDLVSSGTHEGLFNALIKPAGIELAQAGMVSVSVAYLADSAYPLELGNNRPQLGQDIHLVADSVDLVREGLHSAASAQSAPDVAVTAGSSRPLSLGATTVRFGTIFVDVVSATPTEFGSLGVMAVMLAASKRPFELGSPSTGVSASVSSAQPLDFGARPVLAFAVAPVGMDVGRQGRHSTTVAPTEMFVGSSWPLEFGDTGLPPIALHARQSFPLQVGLPAADRGMTC